METMSQKFRPVKTIFQRSDSLWPVGDLLLNDEELDKLIEITNFSWILIENKISNEDSNNHINGERI